MLAILLGEIATAFSARLPTIDGRTLLRKMTVRFEPGWFQGDFPMSTAIVAAFSSPIPLALPPTRPLSPTESTAAAGPRPIGEIMPEVLANYGLRCERAPAAEKGRSHHPR